MRGEIKRILLLLLLLGMIYCQHSPVIHAEGHQAAMEGDQAVAEGDQTTAEGYEVTKEEGESEEGESEEGESEEGGSEEGESGRCELVEGQENSQPEPIKGYDPEISHMEDEGGKMLEQTVQTKKIFLDTQAPKICIAGVSEKMTATQTVEIICRIYEDHQLEAQSAKVEWVSMDGEKSMISGTEWNIGEGIAETLFALSEDGTYCLKVSARDVSGNSSSEELHFKIKRRQQPALFAEKEGCMIKEVSEAVHTAPEEGKPRRGAKHASSVTKNRQGALEYRAVRDMPPVSVKKYDGKKEQPGDRREGGARLIPAIFGLVLAGNAWYRWRKKLFGL